MRRVGILGGSFDPVHAAHLALARAAADAFALDEVRLMPCAQQALKRRRPAPAEDRCALLRLALGGDPRLTLDCRELWRRGKVYTIDTILELRAELPGAELWFILGMDAVADFPRWRRALELAGLCAFIAFDRPGVEAPARPFDPRLLAHRLRGPLLGHSSTAIRAAVANGAPMRYPIGDLEARYLRAKALYQGKTDEADH